LRVNSRFKHTPSHHFRNLPLLSGPHHPVQKNSNDNINPKINNPNTRVSNNWLLQIPYSTPATITNGRIAVNGPNANTLVALRKSVDGMIRNARLPTTASA